MHLVPALLRIYQSDTPSQALQGLAESLVPSLGLRAALYVSVPEREVRAAWPPATTMTADLLDTVMHVLRPEVFPLGSEFPSDAARFPDTDMLVLPLRLQEERVAACVLIAGDGAFGEDPQPWGELAGALARCEERYQRLRKAEHRCEELQRRVEESEALHTLGLAANRTLDKGEVLNLVARFTRTLLGAQYVTVNTMDQGRIHIAASVGLRDAEAASDDYHLARTVIEAEKALTVGGAAAKLRVENFPFHAAEGMRNGLGIPLSLFGDTFGALIVGYRREHAISSHDIRLALALAGPAAVAISNARLHERVEQRSRELAEAYEELSELSRSKERFFASINHELRNPIGAITGYLMLVMDGTTGEIPAAARGFLGKAQRAADTLVTLVNDLLDLSKIAAGKMDLTMRDCTVAEIVDGVLNTIQPLADAKGVPLRVGPLDDAPLLCTDAHRVQQILVNLLSNAVKFTDQGEVRLETDTVERQEASWVEIRVVDSGRGIPPDDQKRIFEEYEQIKGTKGGTGLGLPIARRLARLLGGDLTVESEVGVGSTFVLALPAGAAVPTGVGAPHE